MVKPYQPIGELFDIEKGSLQSTKCTAGQYNFITAAQNWKTHQTYTHECEALVFAAAASGSLGRTHYVNGRFIASDLCYILTPRNNTKLPINIEFYSFVFNSLRPIIVAATKSGTSKEAINQKNFKKHEIPYFDIEQQSLWVEKLKNVTKKKELIGSQIALQKTLLNNLRQRIYQDAISGYLTRSWRKEKSPSKTAEAFIEKLKAEKLRNSPKKAKEEFIIEGGEELYILPSTWKYSTVGELFQVVRGSSPRPKGDPRFWTKSRTAFHWITIADFVPHGVNNVLTDTKGFLTEEGRRHSRGVTESDLIIACSGVGSVGKSIKLGIAGFIYDGLIAIKNIESDQLRDYLSLYLKVKEMQIYSIATGANWLNINTDLLKNYIVPIPPEEELPEILKAVNLALRTLSGLEKLVDESQGHLKFLMSSVLNDAFERSEATASDE